MSEIVKNSSEKYVVLWSGGKDCFLAMLLFCRENNIEYHQLIFVTILSCPIHYDEEFSLSNEDIVLLNSHSDYFGCEHLFVYSKSNCDVPFYNSIFKFLSNRYKIMGAIKGDIFSTPEDLLCNNSTKDDCKACRVRAFSVSNISTTVSYPLTGSFAEDLIKKLNEEGLEIQIIAVSNRKYMNLLKKKLNAKLFMESSLYPNDEFDLLGENGQYQTYVYSYKGNNFNSSPQRLLDSSNELLFSVPSSFNFIEENQKYSLEIIPTTDTIIINKSLK